MDTDTPKRHPVRALLRSLLSVYGFTQIVTLVVKLFLPAEPWSAWRGAVFEYTLWFLVYSVIAVLVTLIARYYTALSGPDFPDNRALTGLLWPLALLIMVAVILGTAARRFVVIPLTTAVSRTGDRAVEAVDRLVFQLTSRKHNQDDYGELWSHRVPDSNERLYRVRVQDSTGTYYIRVPPETKTAQEGVAWSYEITEHQLHNSIRV